MSEDPFERGDVVWHPAPFKSRPSERPFLILSDASHPFHGSEYAVIGLTRTNRPPAVELDQAAWELGDPVKRVMLRPGMSLPSNTTILFGQKGS